MGRGPGVLGAVADPEEAREEGRVVVVGTVVQGDEGVTQGPGSKPVDMPVVRVHLDVKVVGPVEEG